MSLDKMSLSAGCREGSKFKGEASGDPPGAFWRPRRKRVKMKGYKRVKKKTGVGIVLFVKAREERQENLGRTVSTAHALIGEQGPQKKEKGKRKRKKGWLGLGR